MAKRMKEGRQRRLCTRLGITNLVSWPREWRRRELTGGAKHASGSQQRGLGRRVVTFSSAMATESTMEKWVCAKKKKKLWGFIIPCNQSFNLTTCPSSSAAREPISGAFPFDHLWKKGAIVQKVNVSHGEAKMDKLVRMTKLPCIRCLRFVV
jgi:hypothetical protein